VAAARDLDVPPPGESATPRSSAASAVVDETVSEPRAIELDRRRVRAHVLDPQALDDDGAGVTASEPGALSSFVPS